MFLMLLLLFFTLFFSTCWTKYVRRRQVPLKTRSEHSFGWFACCQKWQFFFLISTFPVHSTFSIPPPSKIKCLVSRTVNQGFICGLMTYVPPWTWLPQRLGVICLVTNNILSGNTNNEQRPCFGAIWMPPIKTRMAVLPSHSLSLIETYP